MSQAEKHCEVWFCENKRKVCKKSLEDNQEIEGNRRQKCTQGKVWMPVLANISNLLFQIQSWKETKDEIGQNGDFWNAFTVDGRSSCVNVFVLDPFYPLVSQQLVSFGSSGAYMRWGRGLLTDWQLHYSFTYVIFSTVGGLLATSPAHHSHFHLFPVNIVEQNPQNMFCLYIFSKSTNYRFRQKPLVFGSST